VLTTVLSNYLYYDTCKFNGAARGGMEREKVGGKRTWGGFYPELRLDSDPLRHGLAVG